MLEALDKGVKGGKWFSLIDKVFAKRSLESAFERVRRNKGAAGVDNVTVGLFDKKREANLEKLGDALRQGTYIPQPVKRIYIPKPGSSEKRPLGIPTLRDRVVQTSLRAVLEPIFEKDFAEHSYGFRPGRGCKDALRRVDQLLKDGYIHIVDADIKGYFDSIPHEPLMALVEEKIADRRVLDLIRAYLTMDVFDGIKQWSPDGGTPQGAIISPLLSNIYLDPLDRLMAGRGFEMVRYADDFIVLCRTREEAEKALATIREWIESAELTLHPDKTRLVDASQKGGFDFLGYHFERGMKWAREKSVKKLKEKIKPLTKRANGHSMHAIIDKLNPILRGWFEYFKHGNRHVPRSLDGWTRGRLRGILRKRQGGKGRGRGNDHLRWPNAFFARLGLFSLTESWELARQPARQ